MNEFMSYPDGYEKLYKKLIPWYWGPFRKMLMGLLLKIISEG